MCDAYTKIAIERGTCAIIVVPAILRNIYVGHCCQNDESTGKRCIDLNFIRDTQFRKQIELHVLGTVKKCAVQYKIIISGQQKQMPGFLSADCSNEPVSEP